MQSFQDTVQAGDYVRPDQWHFGEILQADDGYRDSGFPGCGFRLPAGWIDGKKHYSLAVNITITGKAYNRNGERRCRIEFVGDCQPSEFSGGWFRKDNQF